jgi:hypothetical protein
MDCKLLKDLLGESKIYLKQNSIYTNLKILAVKLLNNKIQFNYKNSTRRLV